MKHTNRTETKPNGSGFCGFDKLYWMFWVPTNVCWFNAKITLESQMRLKAESNPVRVECRQRDSCPWQWESYRYGERGESRRSDWLGGWADRLRHLPSVCVVPHHVFKWHRLHFNSDIIHKCGTAAYKSERRKLHCYRKEHGEGETTVYTELPNREGERERVKKTKHLATIRRSPWLSCQVQDLRAGTTVTTLAKGQGLKAAHTHTQTRMNKERQTKLMLVVGFLQTPDAASKSA